MLYHAGFTTAAAAAASALVDLRAVTKRVIVREIVLFNTTATAAILELQRSTTAGTTSTTITPQSGNVDYAYGGDTRIGTVWTVQPASTAVPLRSAALAAAIGERLVWEFPRGEMILAPGATLVVINRNTVAAGIIRGHITIDE